MSSHNREFLALQFMLLTRKFNISKNLSDSGNALSILRNKEVNEAKDALLAINPMLEKYGVLKEKLTLENINSNLVTQSLKANSEIQKILSAGGGERRGAVNVLYSLKEANGDEVEAALREFGFDVHGIEPLNEQRTNAIFFGSRVNKEDVKLVAYVLIRAGVEIQGIFRISELWVSPPIGTRPSNRIAN